MASNRSLSYLSKTVSMEIRLALRDDSNILFEMTANDSKTYCTRVNSSYDLVIKDETFGIPRFCINGAEIEDHPVKVYISPEHTVGIIKDDMIYIPANATVGIPISSNKACTGYKYCDGCGIT